MAANDIAADIGSIRQLHGIIRSIERAVTAVNTASHRTLLDGHLATGVIIDSAGLPVCRIARVNIPRSRHIIEGNLIACGVAIFGIASIQIAGERRLVGKGHLVARSVSGCRLTASDFSRDLNIFQIHCVGRSTCGSLPAVNAAPNSSSITFPYYFTAICSTFSRFASVNIVHLAICECHLAASLPSVCKAAIDVIDLLRDIRELKFIAYSITIISIACVQISLECRSVGKAYLVA